MFTYGVKTLVSSIPINVQGIVHVSKLLHGSNDGVGVCWSRGNQLRGNIQLVGCPCSAASGNSKVSLQNRVFCR